MRRCDSDGGSADLEFSRRKQALRVAVAGMLSLAVAMGVGRFAFTPLMPMMLSEGAIDLAAASWLASANYLGYMLGALLCTLQPWVWSRFDGLPSLRYASIVRAGLVATTVLTLAMAGPWPGAWPSLRLGAGVATALVFVFTSGWCLARLARLGAPAMGGVIFAGPGLGIVVSGVVGGAMTAWQWPAAGGWAVFAFLAALMTASVMGVFRGGEERLVAWVRRTYRVDGNDGGMNGGATGDVPGDVTGDGQREVRANDAGRRRGEMTLLALGYGLAGFGYIITATFLPVIAREAMPGSAWLDLFWPLFGCGVVIGALLATRIPAGGDRRYGLAAAYAMQALGIAASIWSPTLAGFAIGSLMLGLPFTVITFLAMQEARRLRGDAAASFMGLLTATYGMGQIAGPPLVAVLLDRSANAGAAFTSSLQIAAGSLLAGSVVFLWMIRNWPVARYFGPGRG